MRIHEAILVSFGGLAIAADAAADILQFDCVGTESIYTETFEEHQENLKQRPTNVRVQLDLEKKTLSVSGTTNADGKGALKVTPASYDSTFQSGRVIYEVAFKYVQVHMPQARNDLTIITTTHLSLAEQDAEGRLLFRGTCRLPKRAE